MKIYGLCKKEHHSGHGETWTTKSLATYGGYYGNNHFHPLFLYKENAEKWLYQSEPGSGLEIMEFELADAKQS